MPAMKRPAAAATKGEKRGRPARKEFGERQRASVLAALEHAELPDNTKSLLRSLVGTALTAPPRHEMQEQAVKILETELLAVQKGYQAAVEALEAEVTGVEAKRSELQAAAEIAQSASDVKAVAVNEAKEALDAAVAKYKAALEVKSTEEAAQSQLNDSIESAVDKEKMANECISLKESIIGGDRSSVDALDSNLRMLIVETNLLDAVKKTLKKDSEPSPFEQKVLEQLDAKLAAAALRFKDLQSNGAVEKAQAEEKVTAATAEVDSCLDEKTKAADAHSQAKTELAAALKVSKAAKAELKTFETTVPGLQKKLETARKKFQSFDGTLSDFQELKEGPKEPEEHKNSMEDAVEDTTQDDAAQDDGLPVQEP